MKIVFLPQSCIAFESTTLSERPLGGIETAVIRLAEALDAQGMRTIVLTPIDNPKLSSPHYLPFRAISDLGKVDVLISVRDWRGVLAPIAAERRFFWTGDSYDQPQTIGIGDRRVIALIDRFLAVSKWQAETMHQYSGFPLEKTYVLPNGVHLEYFQQPEKRQRKRLIYSSTPYRGLAHLPGIFREIHARHPEAELHVFSGYDVYGGASQPAYVLQQFEAIKAELEALPGCSVYGNILQQELAKEFLKSSLLVYPNTFEETSCITAMEAQAAGCVVVTSARAALPETIGEAGILIPGEPGSNEYTETFVRAVDRLLSDDAYWTELSVKSTLRAVNYSWNNIAKNFIQYLRGDPSPSA